MIKLKCNGVGRDKDCISALQFYFSRPVTDDEMRFLHDVMRRTLAISLPLSCSPDCAACKEERLDRP